MRIFEIGAASASPGIDEHGLIGDGRTCALVRVDGAIDWLCWPRFDAPSVFAAVLDEGAGGRLQIAPKQRPYSAQQRYEPETNVLETLFEVPGEGAVRVTDFMPWGNDDREVHRRITGVSGAVVVEIVFDPRFDYARAPATIVRSPHGALARSGAQTIGLSTSEDVAATMTERADDGVAFETTIRANEHRWVVASWGPSAVSPVERHRSEEQLRATRRTWREWVRDGFDYDGAHRDSVLRSALTLKMMQFAPTGGMVAAPTTSLPEWLGGERNWDYRYVWTRDAAMSVRSMNRVGFEPVARRYFHFLGGVLDDFERVPVMTTIDGAPVPREQVLDHLTGHLGSRPVRIGNGARSQKQLDCSGYLLDAAYEHRRRDPAGSRAVWNHLVRIVDDTSSSWSEPDHGIWEPRRPPRHNLHTKLMAWVTIDRALKISPDFGGTEQRASWQTARAAIRSAIDREGTTEGRFRPILGDGHDADVDAALLVMNRYGFTERGDPRTLATIRHIREVLSDRGYVRRYASNDGVPGHEGAFVLCGFWLVEALALEGDTDGALAVFERHVQAANHLGLLAEEIDAATGRGLGNFPQAFSHLGLIDAALALDEARLGS